MKPFRPPIRRVSKTLRSASAISVGDEFIGAVIDLTSAGLGVVEHPSGVRLFVAGAWPGETMKARVVSVKQRWGRANLVEVIKPSSARISAPCPYHGQQAKHCGGCPWMFVDYGAQLQAKQTRVLQSMTRLGAAEAVQPIWAAPEPLGYRSRAQLKTNGEALGFVHSQSNTLVPVDDCLVLTNTNRNTLKALRARLPQRAWRPQRGKPWSTLDLNESTGADQVAVNERLPFHQANAAQNTRMRAWLQQTLAELPPPVSTLELFAGSGNFTEVLSAAGCSQIVAVEVVEDALDSLREKHLPGVEVVACDLFAGGHLSQLLARYPEATLLVLDPPRDGLVHAEELLIQSNKIRDILYISCDLATFERDVGRWCAQHFQVRSVQPLDLFPQTPHVELLAHLQRVNP